MFKEHGPPAYSNCPHRVPESLALGPLPSACYSGPPGVSIRCPACCPPCCRATPFLFPLPIPQAREASWGICSFSFYAQPLSDFILS